MNELPNPIILLVDDDPSVRESIAMLLRVQDYDVITAVHGFDALRQLRNTTPNVIISDLNMPQMSGFEFLSVVRRRFPSIPVIAISGNYHPGDRFPDEVVTDAFYFKGQGRVGELLQEVAKFIHTKMTRAIHPLSLPADLQIPRVGSSREGQPFILLTCPDCLRSFPLNVALEMRQDVQEAYCQFCSTPVQYVSDRTLHFDPETELAETQEVSVLAPQIPIQVQTRNV